MNEFVEVYSKVTGLPQTVPAHWMDNPILSRDFTSTPLVSDITVDDQQAQTTVSPIPAEMTVAQLRAYAAEHDVDLGDATRKEDIVAAIDAAAPDSTETNPIEPSPVPGDQGTHQED